MKQKIRFEKNIKEGKLVILESSEVDPGFVMPLLEEEYSLAGVAKASAEGSKAFRQIIRRKSFFPTSEVCMKLFEGTVDFFKNDKDLVVIIEYDDADTFPKEERFILEDDDVELDQILEEDGETSEDEIKEIDDGEDSLRYSPEDISEHEN
ncbi:MAG: hypothetical protein A2277_18855 [Desulfobacterales bacterium RIFOXYA12_FULL_46_15]|nr:MAG: hypothetical protein A2097_05380 [Desulfobacula sp. GWF2_41_7]OGR28270.1 MAG: hypothetical protein A2277_18855 [Desulfobacterales bacterium RIFOXYA12_FULL_46_15]